MDSEKKKKRSRYAPHISGALGFLFIVLAIAFTISAFTSRDSITGRLSAGTLEITLLEENFDALPASQRQNIVPRRLTPKDPKVKNSDTTDAFVFLRVTVPVEEVTEAMPDGKRLDRKAQELFYLMTENGKDSTQTCFNTTPASADDTEYWIELHDFEKGTDMSQSFRSYVFGYSIYLKTGETTETLFDYAMLKNLVRSSAIEGSTVDITVEAAGIQADFLSDVLKETGKGRIIQTEETLSRVYSHIDSNR